MSNRPVKAFLKYQHAYVRSGVCFAQDFLIRLQADSVAVELIGSCKDVLETFCWHNPTRGERPLPLRVAQITLIKQVFKN